MSAFKKKRILCVDDSEDDCLLFHLILTEEGYEVESARSFTVAVQLIEQKTFDLCLFDHFLRDGKGLDLLERVRTVNSSMPIIICSGDVRASTQQKVIQSGAQAFFPKPIDFDSLIEAIAQFLD
ncbi:response regulator [Egbenema bharatensis]|uniref:response regulator n=1 Tax=Egbenema bharatensis TaxID=3463334 RepID=UPI003A888C14